MFVVERRQRLCREEEEVSLHTRLASTVKRRDSVELDVDRFQTGTRGPDTPDGLQVPDPDERRWPLSLRHLRLRSGHPINDEVNPDLIEPGALLEELDEIRDRVMVFNDDLAGAGSLGELCPLFAKR